MQTIPTLISFGALTAASALPAPFDLALGFLVLIGLLATDRQTWSRHVAVFVWMLSRVWPAWIHDPYRVSDFLVFFLGGTMLVDQFRPFKAQVVVRRSLELVYTICVLMPVHGTPHVVLGATYAFTAGVVWYTTEDRGHPALLLKTCVWIVCLKTPALAVFPLAFDVWILRRHVSLPRTQLPAAAAPTPAAAPKPPPPPAVGRQIRSSRVPPEYYSRGQPSSISRRTEGMLDPELNAYQPIVSDEV